MSYKTILTLVTLVTTLSAVQSGHCQVTANPTRPSASDNALLTAPGYAELESGVAFDDNGWTLPTLLKLTVSQKLEFGFNMQGLIQKPNSDTDTEVGDPGAQAKLQVAKKPWWAIATVGRVDFPAGADAKYTLYGVGSYIVTGSQIDATLGASFTDIGADVNESLFYALALSRSLAHKLSGYAEFFGENGSGLSVFALDGGLTYSHTPRLITDLSLIVGLTDDAPDWTVQLGLTTLLARIL